MYKKFREKIANKNNNTNIQQACIVCLEYLCVENVGEYHNLYAQP